MAETEGTVSKYELHEAARNGNKLIVQGLLADNPKLALLADDDGRSALHWAVSAQHKEIVKLLLDPSNVSGELTSGIVSEVGAVEGSEKKKPKRLEIDIDEMVDDAGWTPLHIAVSVGNYQIVKLLLEHDPHPDVEQATSTGLTLLHLAVAKKHAEIVEMLVNEYKESARVKDKRGQYPLHRAASVGSERILEFLAKAGNSPLNAKDNSGWTAMHHALAEGNGDVAVMLVRLGADFTIQDGDGLTPLKVSVDEKVAKYFIKACSDQLGIDVI